MKIVKKVIIAFVTVLVLLSAVFLAGRYGWKLFGFRACSSAGIESVEVSENAVRITGFYPGSFPTGFCGCYSEEKDGKLYVGFRFSAVFGAFSTGDFTVTVPTENEIQEVILKTGTDEVTLWSRENGTAPSDGLAGDASQAGETNGAADVTDATDAADAREPYDAILEQYYVILAEGWNTEKIREVGLNSVVMDICPAEPLAQTGYCIADVDGDGTPELAIGSIAEDEFFGNMVFSLYTLDANGVPQLLLDYTGRRLYYYAGENRFVCLDSDENGERIATTLALNGHELTDTALVTDPADYKPMAWIPFSQWKPDSAS